MPDDVSPEALSAAKLALASAGLGSAEIDSWAQALPGHATELAIDRSTYGAFWLRSDDMLARLPPKANRTPAEAAAAAALLTAARGTRSRFLSAHASSLYDALTRGRTAFVRVEELCRRAGSEFPGIVPSADALEREARAAQREKDGLEIDQGVFLAHVLADPVAGAHLCHAMLLPREDARARQPELERTGEVDLGAAHVRRDSRASIVTLRNPRFLNAEDETTLDALEIAVDLALLDPNSEICVLRGATVEHPRYNGRRVFGAGINLTNLYRGRIPYLWYLARDLGYVNKLYRGLARPGVSPEEDSVEKPWIAAVEGFAIGGHCQVLLAVDHVIAESDAYLSLPARREGIVPGAANLRLPRFVGERIAREAIMEGRRLDCASPEGRLICGEIVPASAMDGAIGRTLAHFARSGMVSAASNRRAFRVAQEPLDLFRRYMAVYAREQAQCHFSPALIANLEANWEAANRGATPAQPAA